MGGSAELAELARLELADPKPSVVSGAGNVTVSFPQGRSIAAPRRTTSVLLNSDVPWALRFDGDLVDGRLNLRGVTLRSLRLVSTRGLTVLLGEPSGRVPLRFSGDASDVTVLRSRGAALRLELDGDSGRLTVDGRDLGGAEGRVSWSSPDFEEAAGAYVVEVTGDVDGMTIDTE